MRIGIELIDAVAVDTVDAIGEAVPPFDITQHPLLRHEAWRDGEIGIGGESPEIGCTDAEAIVIAVVQHRDQEAAAALHAGSG